MPCFFLFASARFTYQLPFFKDGWAKAYRRFEIQTSRFLFLADARLTERESPRRDWHCFKPLSGNGVSWMRARLGPRKSAVGGVRLSLG